MFVPTLRGSAKCLQEWFWRELKDGGELDSYLKRGKARMQRKVRLAARLMDGFQQNNKSDLRRLAAVPAELYHRWKDQDEHFWDDNENLRSLKRDNPDLPIYVGQRQMPRGRFHKQYGKSTPHPQPLSPVEAERVATGPESGNSLPPHPGPLPQGGEGEEKAKVRTA